MPCWPEPRPPPNQGRQTALQRRRAARGGGPGRPPAVPQAVCLQEVLRQPQVRQRAAFHPDVRAVASPRRREPVLLQPAERPDVRAVSHLVPAWHLEPVSLQPEDRQGVQAA